jgi:GDP-L-fucose synthase
LGYTKPDGTPKKLMDNTKISRLGWTHNTPLAEGVELVYESFMKSTN